MARARARIGGGKVLETGRELCERHRAACCRLELKLGRERMPGSDSHITCSQVPYPEGSAP